MTRKWIYPILFLCAGLILYNWSADQGINENEINIGKEGFPPEAMAFVEINSQKHQMAKGNYRWQRGNSIMTTDAASPQQIAENVEALRGEPGEKLKFILEQKPRLIVKNLSTGDQIENPPMNVTQAPASPGEYIYEVIAKWANGEVSYTFVLKVEESLH